MTGDPRTRIVPVAMLKELKHGPKNSPLLLIQPFGRHVGRQQPLLECLTFHSHDGISLAAAFVAVEVYRQDGSRLTPIPDLPVWC